NSNEGFLNAVRSAINDQVHKPSVISIGWGAPELQWTDQVLQEFNSIFQQAAMLGITVVAAAGDRGASDGVTDGQTHVDFPASSPLVLACGGTSIKVSDKSISAEVVWNNGESGATGGGVSDVFPRPVWQSGVNIPPGKNGRSGRGLPDVAAHADPR